MAKAVAKPREPKTGEAEPSKRADAQRNSDSLLKAAMAVFMKSGVDAPVRDIAKKAGVGVGTVYRHFPQRSDLIVAVFQQEVDASADAAPALAAKHAPGEALSLWLYRFLDFIATKRGLAAALHSGDPAYSALPAYFDKRLRPALRELLDAAVAAGEVRADVEPHALITAIASLGSPGPHGDQSSPRRMVGVLIDGLRYGAKSSGRIAKP